MDRVEFWYGVKNVIFMPSAFQQRYSNIPFLSLPVFLAATRDVPGREFPLQPTVKDLLHFQTAVNETGSPVFSLHADSMSILNPCL
jgi:hypothetical protein